MTRLRMIVGEAWRSITASMSTTVAATMTVLVAMLVLGTTIGLGTWVLSYSDHLKQQLLVKVYFKNDRTAQQINTIGRRFDPRVNPLVEKLTFVSKEEALKIMQKRLPQLNKGLAYNPYPDAYEIRPTKGEYINDIRAQLRPIPPGVDRVNDGGSTSHRVLKVGGIISVVCLIGVLLLLIASTLLIANTIRLSIFARRREIEVMKLVGATNWFVRGPFMVEGLLCGVMGAFAAVVLLLLGKEIALPAILGHIDTTSSNDVRALGFTLTALILLLVGLVVGAVGSTFTLRRYLKV